MEQNDIVSQIMALIGRGKPQVPDRQMIATKEHPAIPPPQGHMPQTIGMPPEAQDIALQAALGDVPTGSLSMQAQDFMQDDVKRWNKLPPEVLEMVLQGRIPQPPPLIPPQPEWLKRLGPSGTVAVSPLRLPFNRK